MRAPIVDFLCGRSILAFSYIFGGVVLLLLSQYFNMMWSLLVCSTFFTWGGLYCHYLIFLCGVVFIIIIV